MALASKSHLKLTALALALASMGAQADTYTWLNDTDLLSNWSVPTNWSPVGLPTASSDVTITLTGMKTITHNVGNDTINSLTFDAAAPNPNATLLVNSGSSLTVNNGGTNGSVVRADGNGSTVTFAGGTLTNNGTLNATNNGIVSFSNATLAGGTLSTATNGQIQFGNNTVIDGLNNQAVTNNGAVQINSGITTYATGTINNNGSITVLANSDFRIRNSDALTLNGTGTLTLASVTGQNAAQLYTDNGTTITNGANHTIQGAGNFGIDRTVIVNQGTITANVSGATLTVDPSGGPRGSIGLTNTGVMRAEGGGSLVLSSGTYNNQGGTIAGLTGSQVTLNNADIQGGTLVGSILATNGAVLDGVTSAGVLRNTGALSIAAGTTVYQTGTVNNTGTIVVGADADLRAINADTMTFTGNGTLTLASVAGQNAAQLYTDNSTLVTNGAGHTIDGAGNLGIGRTNFLNQGNVLADNTASGTALNVSAAATFTNSGVLRADGGTLNLQQGTFVNGTTIDAINSGVVNITGGSTVIQGGTLNTAGGGQMNISGSARLDGGPNNGAIHNTGTLNEVAGATVYANGTINNTGSIVVGPNADFRMINSDSLTLTGNGTLTLASVAGQNLAQLYTDNGTTITNGAGHTIQGAGNLGIGRTNIVNQGNVLANDTTSGNPLNVSVASTFTNSGVLRADGGTLNLQQGTFINGTTIDAINSGVVNITGGGTVIQGGTLNTASGGRMNISGSARLDGTTNGAINNTGTLNEVAGATVYANGTINNTGSIVVGPNADFRMINSDSLTLTGNGTLTLASVAGQNVAQLFTDNGTTITNGTGHTIQGAGNFGIGRTNIVNQGSVLANDTTSGNPLNVSVASTFTNNGVLRADGGTLNLQNGTFINGTTIDAIRNGIVNITGGGTVIQGGTLNTASGGQMNIGGNARLDGTTSGAINNTGTLNEVAGATVYANGTVNNTGSIVVGPNADFRMINSDSLTLTGNGTLTLASVAGQNVAQLYTDNGTTITNGAGHTIDGAGNFGVGRTVVSNSGIINADSSGQTLNLNTIGPVSNLSTGVLQASNGGTLNIAQAVTGTGTIRSDSGGTVVLNQPAQVGRLINNATLDVGDYSVTVSSDYNNANFGMGNNFNKHAGVVSYGTPLPATTSQAYIVASGDVAQAVTGTNVTNGTGASPTLTIGNVRVGGTTYNYQVANVGTSGPSIRGAIQTSVNGGNITDSQLSGNGVTAGNYGPVGTGSNSGNLGVTFTATTAGALSLQSGQAVHIANNFDNVGEQTLNIALASGAAAYNTAVGTTTPSPVTIGNQRVGGAGSQALTVANTAAAGNYSEALNASFGSTTGATTTNGGSVMNIAAGAANTGALAVGVNTQTAGAKTGSVTIAYQTDGTGSNGHSGLAAIDAGSQTINVSGNVYNVAVGSTMPTPVTIGNQRVGGTASQSLTVSNTAAAGNYSEALNAGFGGTSGTVTTNGGSVSNIAAGASNTGALAVGVNTASSGAKTGSVTIAYQTDGTGSNGHSGLAAISAGSQGVTVSGNVYQAAAGSLLTAPLNFGVVQVGQTVSQTLSIQNSASGAAGYVEDLNASFGAATGTGANRLTGTGSISGLVAGATNSSALTVGVNTSTAGMVNASIAVNYVSAGAVNGVSNGLGTLAVGSSDYGVTGTINGTATVVNQADPVINNSPIALGNVRIGSTSPTGVVSVTNQVNGTMQAALNASISGNPPVTASGSFNGLAPGATNNTSLAVGIDTSSAGAKNGTATIAFVSDATNMGCTTACQMQLASQNVAVSGAVYRLASPTVDSTPITVAARVGTTGPTTSIAVTNTSPDIYTEGLSVSRGATSAGFTSAGGISNLAAGGSSSAIGVTLNTSTAGTFSGTQALNYVSTGAGTDNAADISVGSGSVALNGKVYTAAVAQNNTPSVDFGIVHVGDTVASKGVSVTNAASVTALNDVLVGAAVGASGPFSASGNLGAGLAAQQTSANGLQVGLSTATAGTYSGNATFSAASHDGDLSDAALANIAVSLVGQVNNYASDTFSKTGGAGSLTRSGSTYVLDYGTVAQDSGTVTSSLVATNDATGPADALDGMFQFLDPADFGEGGFGAFMGLAAGSSDGPLTFSFDTATVGSFMDTIVLHGVGTNASGYSGAIGDIELIVRGTVNAAVVTPPRGDVPEPDSLLLLGLGLPLLFLRRGRKQRAH